ncbi:MAG: adenylate/guanylate cyclase domain-containing protein, partial [Pseudomonadota bacterium]
YFSYLIKTIQNHHGIIVDFFGDALLVFFDPLDGPVEPVVKQALACAFEMQDVMTAFNRESRAEGLPELRMGIGLNAGEVVVGNIGSETRAKYGIVGSAVNATSRIQAEAGEGEVVISCAVYPWAKERVIVKRTFMTLLKGIQDEVRLYVVEPLKNKGE